MQVSVIIPVFNRPEYTEVFLENLNTVKHGCDIRPVIVDNGSRKKTKEVIEKWYANGWQDKAKIVTLEKNVGFAGAVTAAFTEADLEEYVCIMHNDCIPFDGWLSEMMNVLMTSDEEVAVVIPRTNYANEGTPCVKELRESFQSLKPGNKDRIDPSELNNILEKAYPRGRNDVLSDLMKGYPMPSSYSIEISSFCMLTKKEFFRKYGNFDADFWPRGYEDKWWFRPLERDGYVCVIANYAYVHHFGNITSDGPGFSFPDNMKINEEKFKQKCLEADRNMTGKKPDMAKD